ncbi:MAG: hypothetical protein A2430_01695 [Candidatus Liptonbacteria bacterium RIFOXYC1_FULL_36_8]|uniref:DUF4012 domain-containing protein n=3 Tax=Candidatus Liptoniibacteriota TaxID=1817909 RepID=A0A1G2CMM7_9BACT|nr:MAG: hypothetical protein A2390_02025 [Candidatus Liptonbacteria bacterium RIFOXYB1_FULL_36_10]OGZ03542.1 MAG: hypothetical protein A2604_00540 [Candidatus Liptonbacteria bacterium RIFOXYD1_FULL_36_11]OGZ04381.1 MAG: hypothetical protein A2430_01695 [Candidatus Liptonbacteria bacterium RIFOXYC1_FULL_36_8]
MRVSKKNISQKMHDIRHPDREAERKKIKLVKAEKVFYTLKTAASGFEKKAVLTPEPLPVVFRNDNNDILKVASELYFFPQKEADLRRKKLKSVFAAVLLFGVGLYVLSVFNLKNKALLGADTILNRFKDSAVALMAFQPAEAKKSLLAADKEVKEINKQARSLGLASAFEIFGNFLPRFQAAADSLSGLGKMTESAVNLAGLLEELKNKGIEYFFNGEGEKLLSLLKESEKEIKVINETSQIATEGVSSLRPDVSFGSFLSFKTDLLGFEDFLDSFISFLDTPEEKHWLVLFQNPSEMRPAGGFIGSYGDLAVKNGALSYLKVSDIYDPDGQLTLKVQPPLPLQAVTTNWGARDANWFFDFSSSAEKVAGFLEDSRIYSDKKVFFDGVAAVNTEVFKSILGITGPVSLPEYDLTVSQDNFLEAIQEEVEVKKTKDKGQPKSVLKDLTPVIIEKIKNLNSVEKDVLIDVLKNHLENKDMMFYAKDTAMESFFNKYDVGGKPFQIPAGFSGGYLAVVNANIAGGKTDAFMKQEIYLKSEIGLDGKVSNFLTVEREHYGNKEKYSWYTDKNQDYMRVLTNLGTKLSKITGDTKKTIKPLANYDLEGYLRDEDLKNLESEGIENGKNVFSAWITTFAGQTKEIRFEYESGNAINLSAGQKFQFVFDKQSGVKGGLHYEVEAPPGFKWAENNGIVFSYDADDSPKRLILELTLKAV